MSEPAAAAAVRPRFLLARSLVVIAVAVAMIGSSAPSPIYGLYQARLHLDHVWLTAIYGAYSVGTVFALFVLGRISDRIGDRRLLLFAALAATLLGALIMAFAHGLPMLLTGRFFAGMGTGCIMGPATAALVELDPARDRVRAAIVATVAVTAGITSGVIISAIALEAEVAPTITPFVVLALSAAAILVALRLVRWAPREVTGGDATSLGDRHGAVRRFGAAAGSGAALRGVLCRHGDGLDGGRLLPGARRDFRASARGNPRSRRGGAHGGSVSDRRGLRATGRAQPGAPAGGSSRAARSWRRDCCSPPLRRPPARPRFSASGRC